MATRDEINALYQKYLSRDGLAEGLDYWVGAINQGATLEDVEYNIVNSPEAAIVNTYQNSLGRTPSIDERRFWVNQSGLDTNSAVAAIQNSEEAQKRQGMLTGTADTTNASRVEDKTSNTTTKAKQLEGSQFDFTDLFYEQILPDSTDIGPGYDPSASEFFGPNVQRFIEILQGYFEDQDQDDIDRILRQGQVQEFTSVLRRFENGDATLDELKEVDVSDLMDVSGFEDYYYGIVGDTTDGDGDDSLGELDATTSNADIKQILRDNGYSEEAIEEIFKAEVNNGRFKGNNVLSNALCQIGYSNCSDWSVKAVDDTGLKEGDKCATVTNGPLDGTIQGGECVSTTPAGPDCKVITQENADECGYEITSDGQLVPKDLSGDPDSYPTYVNCGGGIFAETINDCPDMEGTGSQIPEDQTKTSQAIKDWIEGQIGKVKDLTVDDVLETVFGGGAFDPLCEDESDIWNCAGTDGTEGNKCWKDCVSASVLGGIPGLPMPPGNIDVGTVRDLENKVKEIGGTISDIFSAPQGDADDEGFIQRAKDWVLGKIENIFGGIDDVTPGQITDWITGVLGTTISGIILQEIEGKKNDVIDKINEITGLPLDTPTTLINCADYGRAGGEVERLEECDGCLDKTEDIGTDGRCRKFFKDDFDASEVETTCKREGKEYNDLLDECGDCIEPGHVPGADGVCGPIDGDVDTEVDPRCSNPAFAARNPSLCGQKTYYTEGPGFGSGGQPPETRCTGGKVNVNGKCVCPSGTTEVGGECVSGGDTTTRTPTFSVVCGQKEPYVPTGNALAYNAAYREYEAEYNDQCLSGGGGGTGGGGGEDQCTGGKVRVNGKCVCPSGTTEVNGQCVSGGDTTTTGCSNGATEESGCDTCPDGTSVLQYEDGICPSVSPPLDCSNPAYAAANPQECGTGPECIDCTCAEYAAANPEECGTAPPPETTSGGGGGGGGGAGGSSFGSGMFEMTPTDITAAPELLAAARFPIQNFLQQYVEGTGDQNTSITSLFEGLV